MKRLLAIGILVLAACSGGEEPAKAPPLGAGGFPDAGTGGGGGGDACDVDRDGHRAATCGGDDCDDARAAVSPDATETCNGVDDDCSGAADEGCCTPGDMQACWEGGEPERGVGACHDGVRRCLPSGNWGLCLGAVTPEAEGDACDGVDQDCDGRADGDACRGCPPDAVEICANGLDDDCNGQIDDPSICTLSCGSVNPRGADPGPLRCCLREPPAIFAYDCTEYPGLAACADRACLDLDGDLSSRCTKLCDAGGCVCGRRSGESILPDPGCGFQTPCSHMDCDDRRDQPCYSGPPRTLGVGVCHAGKHTCAGAAGSRAWTTCEGERLPDPEVCGNGFDDDCDGLVDEQDGASGRACAVRADCPTGAVELCGNGLDDDCDGFADEGCPALTGSQACWTGPLLARGVGSCKDGRQTAQDDTWGPCENQVLPGPEVCGDGLDTDCDGAGGPKGPEEAACCRSTAEVCNGLDDDCDGVADDGLINRCGLCEGSCYEAVAGDLSDCSADGRTCDRVKPFALDGRLITLAPGAAPDPVDVIHGIQAGPTFSDPSSLLQIDSLTGDTLWSVELASSFSHVAQAADGTVWVAEYDAGSYVIRHIGLDGDDVCKASVDFSGYGIVADGSGGLWIQRSINTPQLRLYSGSQVQAEQAPGVPWPDGVPRCVAVDLAPSDPSTTDVPAPLGYLALDANRRLWIAGSQGYSLLDLVSFELDTLPTIGFGYSPVVGRDGALYVGYPLRQITADTVLHGTEDDIRTYPGFDTAYYLATDADRTVWAFLYAAQPPRHLVRLDPESGNTLLDVEYPEIDDPFAFGTGVVVDDRGGVWSGMGNVLLRLDPLAGEWEQLPRPDGGAITLASGGSGSAPRDVLRRQGRWTQLFDPGTFDVQWQTVEWSSYAPSGTRIAALVRFSDVRELIDASPTVCGPFDTSPADISQCSGDRRYAKVELLLSGYGEPVAGDVKLTWNRP